MTQNKGQQSKYRTTCNGDGRGRHESSNLCAIKRIYLLDKSLNDGGLASGFARGGHHRVRGVASATLVGGLQARRRYPVICLCVGLEQLNFPKKFISLWTRRHAVSFTRALLRHTRIIDLFHVVSPRKQRPHFSEKSER
jgi:hypothetical protein